MDWLTQRPSVTITEVWRRDGTNVERYITLEDGQRLLLPLRPPVVFFTPNSWPWDATELMEVRDRSMGTTLGDSTYAAFSALTSRATRRLRDTRWAYLEVLIRHRHRLHLDLPLMRRIHGERLSFLLGAGVSPRVIARHDLDNPMLTTDEFTLRMKYAIDRRRSRLAQRRPPCKKP